MLAWKGRASEARHLLDRAAALEPGNASVLTDLGNVCQLLGQHEVAANLFAQALRANPSLAPAASNLGVCLMKLQRFDKALGAFDRAIELLPRDPSFLANRGTALRRLGRTEEALLSFEKALACEPSSVGALFGRALCILESGRLEEAVIAFDEVVRHDARHWEARFHRGLTRLMLGHWGSGWESFRFRMKRPELARSIASTSRPSWQPGEGAGSVLVWAEQGIGDQILGASMLGQFREHAPQLIVQVDRRLVPLLSRSLPEIEFVPCDTQVDEKFYGSHLPMGDLGRWVRGSLKAFDSAQPFLRADLQRSTQLRQELGIPPGKALCGLSWMSTRDGRIGEDKSLPLETFAPLLSNPKLLFVNLQYGDTREEVARLAQTRGLELLQCRTVDNHADLDDLAALIQACDRVVTTSNSTAHLAGGLGVPTELLVPSMGKRLWYWCHTHHQRSLWYPSISIHELIETGSPRELPLSLVGNLEDWHLQHPGLTVRADQP